MDKTYSVRCPNCGDMATRSHIISKEVGYGNCHEKRVIQTECPHCDYLMVIGFASGNVIEAHSSSTFTITKKEKIPNSDPAIPIGNSSITSWFTKWSA